MGPARLALLLALFYAALLADTVASPLLAIGDVQPDWTALVLVVWLLGTRSNWAPLIAAGLGALVDLAAVGHVGPGIIAFTVMGQLVPLLRAKLPSRHVMAEAAAVALGTFGIGLVLSAAAAIAGELPRSPWATLLNLTGTSIYTGAVAVPILMLRNWLLGNSLRPSWRMAR